MTDDDGEDEAVVVGEDEVTVDLTPLVAGGGLSEFVGVPVDLLATAPVLILDFGALVPLLCFAYC